MSTVATSNWILFHCVNHQVSYHEPVEGTVHGVVYRNKLDTQVQRRFRTMHHKMPPSWPPTHAWYKQFKEIGNVLHNKDAVCPVLIHEKVEGIHEVFFSSLRCQFKLKHVSYKCHIRQCSGCYENVCVCMWTSCKWCRLLHQMTGQPIINFQWPCLRNWRKTTNSYKKSCSLIRLHTIFQGR